MSKKHSAVEGGHAEAHHDEMHVTRTTPQGTQEAGVPKGHELRDIKIREVLCWFVGLTVGTIVTSVLMWIFLEWMIGRENDEKTRVASPLYTGEATVRPGPELLPNPAQKYEKDPMKRYVLPWDHYGYFVKDEGVKLKRVGLENGEGRPALPADAVDEVLRELTSSVAPTKERYPQELMPSEGSGGVHEAIQVLAK